MIGLSRCLPFPTKCLTPLADRCFFIRLNRERVQLKPDAEQNFIIQWTNPSVVRFMPHSLHSPHFVLLKAHTCPIGYCRNCFTLYTFRGVYQLFLSSFSLRGTERERERGCAPALWRKHVVSVCLPGGSSTPLSLSKRRGKMDTKNKQDLGNKSISNAHYPLPTGLSTLIN